jgi:surfactin synthase thioesterase subunit
MHREDWEAWSEQAAFFFRRTLVPGGHVFSQDQQAVLVARISDTLTELLEMRGEAAVKSR